VAPGGGYTPVQPPIFGGDGGSGGAVNRAPLYAPATSPLNLIGKVEGWGVGPASSLHDLSIKVGLLTGAQLQKLLRSLPDGMTYELSCEKEEG
jgi:hypothetical protein